MDYRWKHSSREGLVYDLIAVVVERTTTLFADAVLSDDRIGKNKDVLNLVFSKVGTSIPYKYHEDFNRGVLIHLFERLVNSVYITDTTANEVSEYVSNHHGRMYSDDLRAEEIPETWKGEKRDGEYVDFMRDPAAILNLKVSIMLKDRPNLHDHVIALEERMNKLESKSWW